jgi:Putative transposase, YhgA-like
MTPPPIEEFARLFPQNGMKLLLHRGLNVRDLLRIGRSRYVKDIDFAQLQPDPTTYVQRDFRHVESDIVLRGPLKGHGQQRILIYILIEHQSEPDELMAFRVLEYVMQIYGSQRRDWGQTHPSFAGFRFQAVLPVVFYTGERPWPSVGNMASLIEGGKRFEKLAPLLNPVFVPLRDIPAARLEGEGGAFGSLLHLYQQRGSPLAQFRPLLERVVQSLERRMANEPIRWRETMSYLHAMLYHDRDKPEHQGLQDRIAETVRKADHRQEVQAMGKTMADALREEGEQRGVLRDRRQTLLAQLRTRFGNLPQTVVDAIEGCADADQLAAWLVRFATARRLSDMSIVPKK